MDSTSGVGYQPSVVSFQCVSYGVSLRASLSPGRV